MSVAFIITARGFIAIGMVTLLASATGCSMELTDPHDRSVFRGPKAPLPDDPEGKRLNYTPQKRADTKLGRYIQKMWNQLPDSKVTFDPFGYEEKKRKEKLKPRELPPPADPR